MKRYFTELNVCSREMHILIEVDLGLMKRYNCDVTLLPKDAIASLYAAVVA